MPPQVNAQLTAVHEATAARGDRDDWDSPGVEPAGAGAVKWAGSVDVYYREHIDRQAGAELEVTTTRSIILDTADFDAIELDTNDVITMTTGGSEISARAVTIARASLDGIPVELQTTRVELESA